jgi:hypothetical protein
MMGMSFADSKTSMTTTNSPESQSNSKSTLYRLIKDMNEKKILKKPFRKKPP